MAREVRFSWQGEKAVEKGWVTTEEGNHIYIGSDGALSAGKAGYESYVYDATHGLYHKTARIGRSEAEKRAYDQLSQSLKHNKVSELKEPKSQIGIIDDILNVNKDKDYGYSIDDFGTASALTYVAQENGLDVNPDKESIEDPIWPEVVLANISKFDDLEATTSEVWDAQGLVDKASELEKNENYLMSSDRGGAVVRNTDEGLRVLNLTSSDIPRGQWTSLDADTAQLLFSVDKNGRYDGSEKSSYNIASIKSSSLADSESFKNIMGFLNGKSK